MCYFQNENVFTACCHIWLSSFFFLFFKPLFKYFLNQFTDYTVQLDHHEGNFWIVCGSVILKSIYLNIILCEKMPTSPNSAAFYFFPTFIPIIILSPRITQKITMNPHNLTQTTLRMSDNVNAFFFFFLPYEAIVYWTFNRTSRSTV